MAFNNLSLLMGQRLKELREERGLSHVALSAAIKEIYGIDISKDSLINYEVSDEHHTKAYKNNGMRAEYLRCFADFYGVSADWLLGFDVPKTNDPEIQSICAYTGLSEYSVCVLSDMNKYEGQHPEEKIALLALISELIALEGTSGSYLRTAADYIMATFDSSDQPVEASFIDADNYKISLSTTTAGLLGIVRQAALSKIGEALDQIRNNSQQQWAENKK